VYHIIEQPRPEIPVYKVEAGGKEITLHRNLLFLTIRVIRKQKTQEKMTMFLL